MENCIRIGDFVKLTGCTLKTINYYHKIGLLPVPERSAGGYRLYGPKDLDRMRLIKRLKSLGLNLKHIKEIVGDSQPPNNWREVLQSLRYELLDQKKTLEERLAKIDALLSKDTPLLDEDSADSPSFEMITEILGADQIEKYALTCPEIYQQHRKLYGILDAFQWGENHQENFRALAEYFTNHPEKYQLALDLGARWAVLSHLSEDDPQIEAFAREAAIVVNSMPPVKELYCTQQEMKHPFGGLYQEMITKLLTPAQIRYQQLFKKFLSCGNQ